VTYPGKIMPGELDRRKYFVHCSHLQYVVEKLGRSTQHPVWRGALFTLVQQCCFSSHAHLSRTFHHFGVNPSEFRR
jgi:hypothetical protein